MDVNLAGELDAIGGRMAEIVQKGLDGHEWEGDPHLRLAFNRQLKEWEIWDTATSPHHRVWSKPYEGVRDLDMRRVCTQLHTARISRGEGAQSVHDRIVSHNKHVKTHSQAPEESTDVDQLYWAAKKITELS